MAVFIEKILDKTKKWVLPLALLKLFFAFLIALPMFLPSPFLWPLRIFFSALGLLGFTLGTLSTYLDILGAIYYLVKRRKEDRIFLWALLIHTHYFFYAMTFEPIWAWDQYGWCRLLDYTFGGPWTFGKALPVFFKEFVKILLHPTYNPSAFVT